MFPQIAEHPNRSLSYALAFDSCEIHACPEFSVNFELSIYKAR